MNLNTISFIALLGKGQKTLLLTTKLNKSCFEYMLSKVGLYKTKERRQKVEAHMQGAKQM
jgi:hypothetical protein